MGRCKSVRRYSPWLRCAPLAIVMLAGVLIERSVSQGNAPEIHVYVGTNTDGDGIPNGTGTVDLGQSPQGVASLQTFTILNKGTADLTLAEPITLPYGFTLFQSFGTTTLGPGSSTTFVAALNAGDAGSYAGTLAFGNNDSLRNPFTFTVTGGVTPFPSMRIVDDTDSGFSTVGQWTRFPGPGFQRGLNYIAPGTGANTATWTVSGLAPGQYRISVTWKEDRSAADNAPFTILDGSNKLATVAVNQQLAPDTYVDANQPWKDLGTGYYTITANSMGVSVSDNADGNVLADAVRIERVGYISWISDDGDSGFSTSGDGWTVVPGAGFQGGFTTAERGIGAKTATWTFNNLIPGQYRVMATWPADPSLAYNTPYTVLDGSTVVGTTLVNQQVAPQGLSDAATTWQDLGAIGYTITGDTLVVTLSNNANGNVAADAVRIERINYATVESMPDTIRFLEQAAWGPNTDLITTVQNLGFRAWLDQQFDPNVTPPSSYPSLPLMPQDPDQNCQKDPRCLRDNYTMYPLQRPFYTNALYGPDQVRQRIAWSFHKILVTSGNPDAIFHAARMGYYLQIFDKNAFGNFRDILYQITLNAAMGEYLNMATSTKSNQNENYAREIMQLFSIGLDQLNPDGTPILDGDGLHIPTYDQAVVTNMAKVFTGWTYAPQKTPGIINYIDPMTLYGRKPENAGTHDFSEKVVLNGFVIPRRQLSVTNAYLDLNDGLDNIYNHHNVGPFICRGLIQQLVTSNPSPAYVARVAADFDRNRTDPNQLSQVVRAILLDPEARGDVKTDAGYGHLREPVQFVANVCRAFNAKSANGTSNSDGYLNPQNTSMNQNLFRPPTVFSYFPPDNTLILPDGTLMLAPEFGVYSSVTSLTRANFVNTMAFNRINAGGDAPKGTSLDFSPYLGLAGDPGALTDAVGGLLLHGAMSSQMRTSVVTAVSAVAANNPAKRVRTAAYLIATSSQYQVER